MSPARSEHDETRGWIVPVGGAEEKVGHPKILQRFVRLSGEDEARIAIIPTASSLDETGTQYEDLFLELGADKAKSLPYRERIDTESQDWLDTLDQATGVFFTGGNQLRLSATLGGTQSPRWCDVSTRCARWRNLSRRCYFARTHDRLWRNRWHTDRRHGVLSSRSWADQPLLIDQHFRERDRLGRLLSALSYNPLLSALVSMRTPRHLSRPIT